VARGQGEAARRSAVGGQGIKKPIGVVPKAEVGRLSVSPRCAPAVRRPDRSGGHSGRRRLPAIGLRGRGPGLKIKFARRIGELS
jgi:hypothetical protein